MALPDGSDIVGQRYVRQDGEHYVDIQILRRTYHRVLMERCEKAKHPYMASKCVVDIHQTEAQEVATFSDGTTTTRALPTVSPARTNPTLRGASHQRPSQAKRLKARVCCLMNAFLECLSVSLSLLVLRYFPCRGNSAVR
ncbi:hypothetical protein M427DRAFT_55004 [Gonapodya prolifera JEL478]|uniref:Uncharacterized protein n=1 Tax=Gonapodya prolifera (strain JEL478) TaxID=1344416 RepID=A0A139AKE5_GONPJ|nr:hypothetical protein M427DRAFT_55004 [Gonapodya prolifera JEL478]|eukprot:KXS16973.1 hypothetical protein M427DRAFT_55004 [Gonapodya prolifera JEL478]